MPTQRGKEKQKAKRKKKRELAKRKPRPSPDAGFGSQAQLVREAALLPQGRAFLSAGWRSADEQMPQLVTAVVTRVAPAGMLIASVALVDRTCLGIKNAFVSRPMRRSELAAFLERVAAVHGGIEEADLVTVQSIVFHALDYARSLGFQPNRDFPEPLFGPRPDVLLDTPLAQPSRPTYVSGPDDDPAPIVAQLTRAVGEGGFGFMVGTPPGWHDDEGVEDEDDEGDEDA